MRRPLHKLATVSCIVMLVAVSFAGVAFNPSIFPTDDADAIHGTASHRALTVNFAPAEERESDTEDELDDVAFDDAEHHRAPSGVQPTCVAPQGLTSLLAADRLHRPPIG
ncbi:MAG: hypothetical protein Q8L48_23385 [Archangium sp.]|nr:hypothetical protein [Archangium sp.]